MIEILDSLNLNLGILVGQMINILILIFVFKRALGDKVAKHLQEKRAALKRLTQAEQAYADMIQEAEQKAQVLVQEGVNKKESLIAEAGSLAEHKKQEILEEAHTKADIIIKNAERDSKEQHANLEKNFVDAVKHTANTVVKKILKKDKELKDEYFTQLSADFA